MAVIALVEDDDLNRRLITYLLRKISGVSVVEFANGRSALEYFQRQAVDVILMDYQLPEIAGRELVGKIKELEHYRGVPIIALTAYIQDKNEYLSMGFTEYISKPIDNELFMEAVKKYIV